MSDDRKKPFWPWIVILLIGLSVLYAASSGPLSWMRRSWLFGNSVAEWCDRPFELAEERAPEWISEPLFRYRSLFLTDEERELERLILLVRRNVRGD
jgi:hypothetical protein